MAICSITDDVFLVLFVITVLLILKCSDMNKYKMFSNLPLFIHTLFPIHCLCILAGADHGDDDGVLLLYLHHSGNVPCLLMQIRALFVLISRRLSFWWIVANCQWGLDQVHNINLVWQAVGIMQSSVCCSKHTHCFTVKTTEVFEMAE